MGLGIKKGDTVRVISGAYRGASGKVLANYPDDDKLLVEGINVARKHRKPRSQTDAGGIIQIERPIHLSNRMVVDAEAGSASRIKNVVNEQGKKVRVSKFDNEV